MATLTSLSSSSSAATSSSSSASKISLHAKRELKVTKLVSHVDKFKEILNVLVSWDLIAWDKRFIKLRFFEVHSLCSNMATSLKFVIEQGFSRYDYYNCVVVCEDVALKELQTIAFVNDSPSKYEIVYMVTNPHNVRDDANKGEMTRVEGAGSAIIDYLALNLPDTCKGLEVATSKGAKGFYGKNGFVMLDPVQHPPRLGAGECVMWLSAETIQTKLGRAAVSQIATAVLI